MTKNSFSLSKRVVALFLMVTVTVTAFFAWRMSSDTVVQAPEEVADYLFWRAKQLDDFTLMAAGNNPIGLDQLKGKWSFVFFGYTFCPDICPTTMGALGSAFNILEKDPVISREIQGIFISVDPKRDTPESLLKYSSYFHPKFSGITGTTPQIDAVARQMGALYTIHPGESEDNYLVSHNSTVFVVDPRGRLYGRFPPPLNPREIADVFIRVRAFYNRQEEKRWSLF